MDSDMNNDPNYISDVTQVCVAFMDLVPEKDIKAAAVFMANAVQHAYEEMESDPDAIFENHDCYIARRIYVELNACEYARELA